MAGWSLPLGPAAVQPTLMVSFVCMAPCAGEQLWSGKFIEQRLLKFAPFHAVGSTLQWNQLEQLEYALTT